ncbi:ubiquitin protein ligase E3A [Salpingoeca rosetta]|uniref:HECT-type E3 ubiquitin transferase n=1 Tax=Salpingoeca rosetta (strain ATCC 50818 / BSB-021) TaxID=946362 RepID=F2U922_SALR5|nr:ubiquitin protein ligase E3A [Salpingoeca rosetta]EGD73225.1 ubiquitin protein ligase E3A [Salpingoeca rosetta]|eukprot:XP_004994256.1 ubiquitin protein ligase E3A [Salpingoeca rosetta]
MDGGDGGGREGSSHNSSSNHNGSRAATQGETSDGRRSSSTTTSGRGRSGTSKKSKKTPIPPEDYSTFLKSCRLLTKHYVGQYFLQYQEQDKASGKEPNPKDVACRAIAAVQGFGLQKLQSTRRGVRLEHITKHKGPELQQFMVECFSHLASLGHLFFEPSTADSPLRLNWREMGDFYAQHAEELNTSAMKTAMKTTLARAKTILQSHDCVSRNNLRAIVNLLFLTVLGMSEEPEIVVAMGRTLRYVFSPCANAIAHVLAMLPRELFADMVRRVEAALAIHVLSIPEPSVDYHGVVIHPMYKDRTTKCYLQLLDMLFISNLRRRPVTIIQGVDFAGAGEVEVGASTPAGGDEGEGQGATKMVEDVQVEGDKQSGHDMDTAKDEEASTHAATGTASSTDTAQSATAASEAATATSGDGMDTSADTDNGEPGLANAASQRGDGRGGRRHAGDDDDDEGDGECNGDGGGGGGDNDEEDEEACVGGTDAGQSGGYGDGDGDDDSSDTGGPTSVGSDETDESMDGVAALRRTSEREQEDMFDFNFDPRLLVSRKVDEPIKNAGERIPLEDFVNEAISEEMDYLLDVVVLLQTQVYTNLGPVPSPRLSFSRSAPYVLSVDAKAQLFSQETTMLQNRAARAIFGAGMFRQSLNISVHRDTLVRDTITQLSSLQISDPDALKRPLRIKFRGEQGLDEGGLKKEFFQLLIRELFDPKYGMFVYHEETRFFYFSTSSLEAPDEYRLLGMLLGLAMYNRVILDVHFPFVVYKKLRGEAVGLEDLAEFNPELARGLKQLLDYPGDDVEDVFCRTFSVESEVFGARQEHELKPGGKDIPLTSSNKEEYVRLYVDWILNKSIERQFSAFRNGFTSVVSGSKIIKLLTTKDLQQIICGEEHLDFDELERVASYDHGYQRDSTIVKWFWEIVKQFSDEDKKKLLFFTTGSDRVPVGGLSKMAFVICKQGADSDQLPTSHTCFNTLMLPEYPTKEKLEQLLRKAISHAEGFGML